MNWLKRIAQADLSWILSGPSEDSRVGPESGSPVSDGISIYKDPHGSYRYVYYEQNQAVAGIQVMFDGQTALVANVYTHPTRRCCGLATDLFRRVQSDFPNLQHSGFQTGEGDSWITSLSQKSMPLPTVIPSGERGKYRGIPRMDDKMTQETADQLRQQYPEIEYGGAGAIGIAFQTGPNEIMKVTHDFSEANRAKTAFENSMNWVVPILEEPQMIQDNPPMWSIRMKKLQPIVKPELQFLVTNLNEEYGSDSFPSQDIVLRMAPNSNPDEVMEIYSQMKYILEQNAQTFWLEDIHGENVGWDDDGNLKVFDLGPGRFVP